VAQTPVDDQPPTTSDDAGATPPETTTARRARFRESMRQLADRSTSDDLVRWMLVPGSIAVILGFAVMLLGWIGAARTAREIEQIPYLISGGLIGLALVLLGGLLLMSTFWVAVLRKLQGEQGTAAGELDGLRRRIEELEAARPEARRASRPASAATSTSRTRTRR
jgi:hypothetical protein